MKMKGRPEFNVNVKASGSLRGPHDIQVHGKGKGIDLLSISLRWFYFILFVSCTVESDTCCISVKYRVVIEEIIVYDFYSWRGEAAEKDGDVWWTSDGDGLDDGAGVGAGAKEKQVPYASFVLWCLDEIQLKGAPNVNVSLRFRPTQD